jgi:hypothetical protein
MKMSIICIMPSHNVYKKAMANRNSWSLILNSSQMFKLTLIYSTITCYKKMYMTGMRIGSLV